MGAKRVFLSSTRLKLFIPYSQLYKFYYNFMHVDEKYEYNFSIPALAFEII